MEGDRVAGRPVLLSLPVLLLLPLLLSRAAALHPDELFPFGESWGDQLLQEGDDESSAVVKLANPLHFYEAQFSNLYVSSAPSWHFSRSFFPGVALTETLPPEGRKHPPRPEPPSTLAMGPGQSDAAACPGAEGEQE